MHVEKRDSLDALVAAMKSEGDGRVRDRIRAVVLAGRGRTAREVAEELDVSPRAVQDWVRWYNEGGLTNLPDGPRSGQPRKCLKEKFAAVKARLTAPPRPGDGVCTLRGRDVRRILGDEFGVVQTLSTTYALMHTLGLEPLRPRPRHIKNDPQAMQAWEERAPLFSRKSAPPTRTRGSRSGTRMKRGSANKAR